MPRSANELIITLPSSGLRRKSQRISVITPEVKKIIDDMKAATLDWEASRPHEVGVALAAIQIDQPLRIIIVRNNFDNKDDKSFSVFINPEIVKKEGALEEDFEGCLSVKDVYGKVPRYPKIRLRALDEEGRPIRVRAEGFLARVLQHEVDHLQGMVFVDHIEDRRDAFYKINEEGKLESYDYDRVAYLFR
ncbi:TPA: peptide deformylase [Candidatus Saccharibacteria bacterium]|nr:MAG: peptide deformylase [Candidatus Saccharibacteria bacterium RIFCSPHIGHO2_12_FULL_47_17]HCM52059.1 peptide deformylase [Candidatus Saccharibacteria bacterium]